MLFASNGYEFAKRKTVQITPKTVEGMISGTEEHLQPVIQSSLTLSHSVLKLMDTVVRYLPHRTCPTYVHFTISSKISP